MIVNTQSDIGSSSKILTFEKDLRHAFTPLNTRLEKKGALLDDLLSVIRLRIDSESEAVRGLQKVLNRMEGDVDEYGTTKDAFDAIRADVKNEFTSRNEYANSLNDDVYKPLVQLKDHYVQNNRRLQQSAKQSIKALQTSQNKLQKTTTKYEKAIQDANIIRIQLLAVKEDSTATTAQSQKIQAKMNGALQIQQQWKDKLEEDEKQFTRTEIRCNEEMTTVLQSMEANELARVQTVGDCLRKWAVFTTNVCANRNYDIQSLAQIMSLIKPEDDLQAFITATIAKVPPSPPTNTNLKTTGDAPFGYEFSSFSRKSISTSLTVESKSVEGSMVGAHELIHPIDVDASVGKEDLETGHARKGSDIDPRQQSNTVSKLFTGLATNKKSLEQVSESPATVDKTDAMSVASNDSDRSRSNSNGSFSSGVSDMKRSKKLKKPRRLIYDPSSQGNDGKSTTAKDSSTSNRNSKLVGDPRPTIPPPRPPMLSPILDVQEGEEAALTSPNFALSLADNKFGGINQNNQDLHTNPDITTTVVDKHNSISLISGDTQVISPRNTDMSEEPNLQTARIASIPSTTSTPTLSGADSQFEWGPRTPPHG